MALDLKPLTDDVIKNMGYTSHDLWLVKIDAEIFGPFEVTSLKGYAAENEKEFTHAQASIMDANHWQPFFSHTHFIPQLVTSDRYWILDQGQKVGPLPLVAVQKKIEMGILTTSDMVSKDEGVSWTKFMQDPTFNPGFVGGVDSLPHAPTESSFVKAKEELTEWMDNHDRSAPHAGLANLMNLVQVKENEKPAPKLEEMDLKSLNETEVSRSLKWAVPSAVAALGVLAVVGKFLLTPAANEMTLAEEKAEVVMPKAVSEASTPAPRGYIANRAPANYNPPIRGQRSALTNAPQVISNAYPSSPVIETHEREMDPINDQLAEKENNGDLPEEHSLVSKPMQINPAEGSLDQAMMGSDPEAPEAPVIEEAADF